MHSHSMCCYVSHRSHERIRPLRLQGLRSYMRHYRQPSIQPPHTVQLDLLSTRLGSYSPDSLSFTLTVQLRVGKPFRCLFSGAARPEDAAAVRARVRTARALLILGPPSYSRVMDTCVRPARVVGDRCCAHMPLGHELPWTGPACLAPDSRLEHYMNIHEYPRTFARSHLYLAQRSRGVR